MGSLVGGLIVLGVIVVSMTLHELAHGVVAYLLGDTTAKEDGRLTLNPIKHLDPVMSVLLPLVSFLMGGVVFGGAKPVPINLTKLKGGAWGMALVAIAGPLTNLVLAFLFFVVAVNLSGEATTSVLGTIVVDFVMVNLGFAVFNMIPIPPLDGSRVLYALMPDFVRGMMEKVERFGIVLVYVLIVVGGGVYSAIMTGAITGVLEGFYWIVGK